MAHIFVPPPPSWSAKMPPRLEMMIGRLISLASAIDTCVIESLWVLEEADIRRKKKIARVFAKANADRLQKFVESIPGAKTDVIWPVYSKFLDDRNIAGHGVWMVDDKHVPWVVWHSKFLEQDDEVVSEQFPYERFEQCFRVGDFLLDTFRKFKGSIEKLADKKKVTEDAAKAAAVLHIPNKWPL